MNLLKTLLAIGVVIVSATPCTADPPDPLPVGVMNESERQSFEQFLQHFRRHGDYHSSGTVRLHVHGNDKNGNKITCPTTTAPSELIYAVGTREYIIKSNRYFRIWGDYTVYNKSNKYLQYGLCAPFDFLEGNATQVESISRFAAVPLLTLVDMLRNAEFTEQMLYKVSSIQFFVQPGDASPYRLILSMRDGSSMAMQFDAQAKFLTSARFTFSPSVRPANVNEMYAEWTQRSVASLRPHRTGAHTQEIRNAIRAEVNEATSSNVDPNSDEGQPCHAPAGGPAILTGTTGPSGMTRLLTWIFYKTGVY